MNESLIFTSEMFEDAKKYWMDKLSGELNLPRLVGDFPTGKNYVKAGCNLTFTGEIAGELTRIGKNDDLSCFVILLTVFKILIHKYTGQDDIVVSSPTRSESSQNYNKWIALRDILSPRMSFKEFLIAVKNTVVNGYKNQFYPIRKLIKFLNIPDNPSLFTFICLMENIHRRDLDIELLEEYQTDIFFLVNRDKNHLQGSLIYNSKLFKEKIFQKLCDCYIRILTRVLENIDIKIRDIDIITPGEKKKILIDFNRTGKEYPKDKTLHQLFWELAEQTPDQVAVVSREDGGNVSLTYKELNEKAHRLAAVLMEKGVKPDTIVGIMVERSLEMIIGILGILKAGSAYMPIDPDYPEERIQYMLADSSANVLLKDNDLPSCLSSAPEALLNPSAGRPFNSHHSESLAYIIYTSGSTGKPKGVLVGHKNVVRLVKNTNFIDAGPGDRLLLTGASIFDIITFEIWYPLLNGLALYLVHQEMILDVQEIGNYLVENKISILHLIPQLFNELARQQLEIFSGLKYLLVGGDLVRPQTINRLRTEYPAVNILHCYGPTENTTFSTILRVDRDYPERLPIGKPISNSSVYIVDKYFQLQPIGIPGELCTGGDGVARGYLNNPGLTAEKFISLSFNLPHSPDSPGSPYSTIYRTGDLARWFSDGNIEFLGRVDLQVKIMGLRIEVGEIENRLRQHENVREAVVIARDGLGSDQQEKFLCAYIVPNNSETPGKTDQLKEYLIQTLPNYMVPPFFVQMEKMPLNPNGKIDRKVLPAPELTTGDNYTAPGNEIEHKLTEIWSGVLGVETGRLGIDHNFFRLGGHSLNATIMVGRIHKTFRIRIPLQEIFMNPSIRGLAGYIKKTAGDRYLSINPVEKKEYYVLSSAQKRFYVLQQMDLENTAFNVLKMVVLEEELKRNRLEEVFKELIKRNESLRTSFQMIAGEVVQYIHEPDELAFEVEYVDYEKADIDHTRRLIDGFTRAFDLSRAPLFRAGLVKIAASRFILMVDMHHIITDGISTDILEKDFTALYGEHELPEVMLQYKDYSGWQNSMKQNESIKKQKQYWLSRFAGEIPVLNMPTDYPRPPVQRFEGSEINSEISSQLTAKLKEFISGIDITMYMLLLAAYNILLMKYTGQDVILVGSPVSGRTNAELQQIIGLFVNMLVMENHPHPHKTFLQFLEEVKKHALEAFENQDYQFDELVDALEVSRNRDRHPLIDTVFTYQNDTGKEVEAGNFPYQFHQKEIQHELLLDVVGTPNNIIMILQYSTVLFKESTARGMSNHYIEILEQISQNPNIILKDIKISIDWAAIPTNSETEEGDFDF